MSEYQRLIREGYKPVKAYTRFVLFESKKTKLRETLLWRDLKKKELYRVMEVLDDKQP